MGFEIELVSSLEHKCKRKNLSHEKPKIKSIWQVNVELNIITFRFHVTLNWKSAAKRVWNRHGNSAVLWNGLNGQKIIDRLLKVTIRLSVAYWGLLEPNRASIKIPPWLTKGKRSSNLVFGAKKILLMLYYKKSFNLVFEHHLTYNYRGSFHSIFLGLV